MKIKRPSIRDGQTPRGGGRSAAIQLPIVASGPNSSFYGRPRWLPVPGWSGWQVIKPAGVLLGCAALFVGADVVEHHFFPTMPTGWRHAALTARAAIVSGFGCLIVFLIMRNQQQCLVATAERLGGRLEAYRDYRGTRSEFQNDHRVRCWDVLDCKQTGCPAHGATDRPCWQKLALSRSTLDGDVPETNLQACHKCKVYLASCPDGLTRLGESFNSLMYMLDQEAKQVRLMNAQLVEKEKMVAIGQMASGIAHEIGNPLSSISSIVQMIERRPQADRIPEQAELIATHVNRISKTVRQLSSLARPVRKNWTLDDIGPALEESIKLIKFDRRAKSIQVDLENHQGLPKTFMMREELVQVFINLALNALDSMPSGGSLRVGASRENGSVIVRFSDTGTGIPTEIGRRVFEPFFTTKEAGKGTGLGLSVSYGIVQEHAGEIDFFSNEGEGTTFSIRLPVLTQAPEVPT